ncbi:MAG TPA: J domain-containing protein [Candidatus Limnocylindrales bacterium]|nr:J domain-containing protein [Candidatus Limnocylindrales bacterium]
MNIADPYKTLQVDPEAEDEVIEAAYRRLARKYHPDVAPGPEAQDRMVRINQAWEMLRDPSRRAAVDRARARTAGSAARAAAAEARARATAQARGTYQPQASSPRPAAPTYGSQGGVYARQPNGVPSWGFPGGIDPTDPDPGSRTQFMSPNWTSGRSTDGHAYDQGTMGSPQGDGAAGPPPGNPFGSVLNFGRYAGWSLGEIGRADLEYLEWLDRMPIGRTYQAEIDEILRSHRRRTTAPTAKDPQRGLFRRR